ncbi:hypothetical protein AAFC00_006128 [Neodothiora populina]|uniref:Gag1-like clamp domain-containing protein n=1 Tax=Neodothiora populina TaxID=2781224 RepID=A0ABR3P5K1_9PEZI
MPLHLGLPHGHAQEETREARRMLQDKVRNDWEYPSAPHPHTHTSAYVLPNAKEAVAAHVMDGPQSSTAAAVMTRSSSIDFEPIGWRERVYSDNETSDDEDGEDRVISSGLRAVQIGRKSGSSHSAATSMSQLSNSGGSVTAQKEARKRKRQEKSEEEMTWNIGLAHYSAQRNAWTAARSNQMRQANPADAVDEADKTASTAPAIVEPKTQPLAIAEDASVLLPIAPRLLPNHPVRRRITSHTYSEIYSKVILQARTPTIPINLQDITNALIHGWKEEGNWPPKPAAPEPSVATSKKNSHANNNNDKQANGKDAVKNSEASGGAAGAHASSPNRHPHLTKGMNAVTKVFHGLTGGPLDGHRG